MMLTTGIQIDGGDERQFLGLTIAVVEVVADDDFDVHA